MSDTVDGLVGETVGSDEVRAAPGGDHSEYRVRHDGLVVLDHPVDDLVDGSVAAHRDHETGAALERGPRQLARVPATFRMEQLVLEVPLLQDALDLRK
jgi:hypothetical protein